MKKIKNLLVILLSFTTTLVIAQSDITEGSIKVEITDVSSDNEQIAAQLEMMKGSITEYMFSEEKSMVSADMMGGMIKIKSIINNSDEHMTMLFDAMGQKMMIESTKAERDKAGAESNADMEGIEVIYDESDTKEILGYKCVKATLKSDEEMPMNFSMYVAKDIKASNKLIQGLQAFEMKGFPLEYTMETPQMNMTFTATDLQKSLDKSVFDVNTSGYTKMSFDEFQQQMGAMGGGMGF